MPPLGSSSTIPGLADAVQLDIPDAAAPVFLADKVVRLPMYGQAESLNLAQAVAVCLFATATTQRSPFGSSS